jgi:NDP-sugar pyrophosphorylase family protein
MYQIVILCGGMGKRMYPLTKKIPKSLLKINKKPFLYYQLKILEKFNFKEIILCVGHFSNDIIEFISKEKFKLKITIASDGKKLVGTGGAIKKILNILDDKFFVIYGDSLLKLNYNLFKKKFDKSNKDNIMCVKFNKSKVENGNVKIFKNNIYYNKSDNLDSDYKYIDYGCSILSKKSFLSIKRNNFDLGFVFKKLCDKELIDVYITKNNYYEIGSKYGYKKLKAQFNKIY